MRNDDVLTAVDRVVGGSVGPHMQFTHQPRHRRWRADLPTQ